MRDWIRKHASVLFLAMLMVATFALFFSGLFLTEEFSSNTSKSAAFLRAVGVILINLSGVGVAAIVTTLFFSFNDVQEYLSSSVARMFSEASVVTLLSTEVKSRLRRRLTEDATGIAPNASNTSLHRHVSRVTDAALEAPYASNFNSTITFSADPRPGCRRVHDITTYRIHAEHIRPNHRLPIQCFYSIVVPKSLQWKPDDWIESAVLVVGKHTFSKEHFRISVLEETADTIKYSATLEEEVELTGPETDYRVELKSVSTDTEPMVAFFARYATMGFTATVLRDSDHMYGAAWFLCCEPRQNLPDNSVVTNLPNGLSVRTNDWVLPGEGVTILFWRKPDTDVQSARTS